MSRYIDAEWIRNIYADFEHYENRDDWTTPITNVLAVIDDAPSIDIVRCRDCKWRKADNSCDLNCRIEYLDGTETDMWFYVKPDDFCSYGEREGE